MTRTIVAAAEPPERRPECCPIHNAEPGALVHYADPGTRNATTVAITWVRPSDAWRTR